MRLSRNVMPLEKNRMGFIHSGVPVQEEFPSKEGRPSENGDYEVHIVIEFPLKR